MTDFIVAEFMNSVDSVILLPIQQTQRIKYTAYDVSEKYIVFGASSGGLYIFNRHPCSFMKLIPSTEGAVVNLSISNDEKIIAVATSRGTLCLFDNDGNSRNIQVFHEHLGSKITAMKWNHNSSELYCGDESGKISVVVTNFITKTVFQSPSATLMQLDSRIVQLDWSSYFLLVSTLTRCYLCDTKSEHYRQIGKKLREGEFGSCFFGTKFTYTLPNERKFEIGKFNILNDKESFITYDGLENLKMFCARPGARIWEVQLNGTVVRTHQFKEALTKGSNHIISLDNKDGRLNFLPRKDTISNGYNFMKMYVFNNFILTFQKNGLYILDPQNVAVIFWTDYYSDIIDVRIINRFIYLWTSSQMHVLLFSTLENFVIKSLLNKMYLFCADLCIIYQSQIKKLLPISNKLYLLSCLNEKLSEVEATDVLDEIQPILNAIKELTMNRQSAQKLSSGIFIVDNAHFINNLAENDKISATNINKTFDDNNIRETLDMTETIDTTKILDNTKTVDSAETTETIENTETKDCLALVDTNSIKNKKLDMLLEEYELNKINAHFQTTILKTAFNSCQLFEITDIFSEFPDYFRGKSEENCDNVDIWCYNTCLKYIETNFTIFAVHDIEISDYIKEAFVKVNSNCEDVCKCNLPLPKSSTIKPKFYKIGQSILLFNFKLNTFEDICKKVPYMWKEIVNLRQNENITNLLPLIIQYGDIKILRYFSNKFTYDIWSEILKKFIFLKSKYCLNCEQKINKIDYFGFSWNDLATEMVKSIGAESTINLLLENCDNIPKAELDINFYQCCIFSTMVGNLDMKLRSTAVQFVTEGNRSDDKFGQLLEKTLLNRQFSTISLTAAAKNCSYCFMPLQTPVLCKEKLIELKCGHYFHNICFKRHNNICNMCLG